MAPFVDPAAISVTANGAVHIDTAALNQFIASGQARPIALDTNTSSCGGTNGAGCTNNSCSGNNATCINTSCGTTTKPIGN